MIASWRQKRGPVGCGGSPGAAGGVVNMTSEIVLDERLPGLADGPGRKVALGIPRMPLPLEGDAGLLPMVARLRPGQPAVVVGIEAYERRQLQVRDADVITMNVPEPALARF